VVSEVVGELSVGVLSLEVVSEEVVVERVVPVVSVSEVVVEHGAEQGVVAVAVCGVHGLPHRLHRVRQAVQHTRLRVRAVVQVAQLRRLRSAHGVRLVDQAAQRINLARGGDGEDWREMEGNGGK